MAAPFLSAGLQVGRRVFPSVLHDVKTKRLTLLQTGKARLLHSADVDEHVFGSVVGLDEAKPLCGVEPFHSTGRHNKTPYSVGLRPADCKLMIQRRPNGRPNSSRSRCLTTVAQKFPPRRREY